MPAWYLMPTAAANLAIVAGLQVTVPRRADVGVGAPGVAGAPPGGLRGRLPRPGAWRSI